MDEAGISPPEGDAGLVIHNLGRVPLEIVLTSDSSALDNALRRLLQDIAQPGENYAAHGTTP